MKVHVVQYKRVINRSHYFRKEFVDRKTVVLGGGFFWGGGGGYGSNPTRTLTLFTKY